MLVEEACGGGVVDERVVGEPLNGSTVGTGVAEGVPGRQQAWILLVQFVLEPAKAP
jgi:hypothetical protein